MGFFYEDDPVARGGRQRRNKSTAPTSASVQQNRKYLWDKRCDLCPLDKEERNLVHPKMVPTGAQEPWIYVLGEAPGETEDREGAQFVGESGKLLRGKIPRDLRNHIRWNNAVNCRPPKNRNPTTVELECCRKWVEEDIERTKPDVILLFGKIPTNWALEHTEPIANWRGRRVPVQIGKHRCWAFPLFHPAFILRLQNNQGYGSGKKNSDERNARDLIEVFDRDLKEVWDYVQSKRFRPAQPITKDFDAGCMIVTGEHGQEDFEKVKAFLRKMARKKWVALDYETNGLRPYAKGAKLLTVAVGTDQEVMAFPLQHPEGWKTKKLRRQVMDLWTDFLLDSGLKIAHNVGFEQEWSAYFCGVETILETEWADTMAQAYVLDERKGMHDLDTLVLIRFGFHLKSLSADVDRKRILQSDYRKVLRYNALDTKWAYALYVVQDKEIRRAGQERICKHVQEMSPSLVMAQLQGLVPDWDKVEAFDRTLSRDIRMAERKIYKRPEIQEFEKKRHVKFNMGSPDHTAYVFHKLLGREEVVNKSKASGFSVDANVLEKLQDEGVPLADLILQYRGVTKIKSTYIDAIMNEEIVYPDGRIHTDYSTMWTTTGRLSSKEPNVQNQPKRKHSYVRQVFRAEDGCVILSVDFGQIEARVIAAASRDKEYCKAIWEGFDTHMAWGERIIEVFPQIVPPKLDLDSEEGKKWKKGWRNQIKNGLTFPAFYGASEEKIARILGLTPEVGKKIFTEFWETYAGVKRWQERVIKEYHKTGYSETLTGRKRHAPMTRQAVINSPIQGAASDIVTYAMNRLRKQGIFFTLQIHDDLTFTTIKEKKVEDVFERIVREMVNPAPDSYLGDLPWLVVPLTVEAEVGYNWGDQTEIGTFSSADYDDYKHVLSNRYNTMVQRSEPTGWRYRDGDTR